jgi:outer membrane PBP1 activator LpoA protein
MDNLKLTGNTEEEFQQQMQTVRTFSDDNHIKFGLDKCAKTVLKKGKLVQSQNLIPDINREIQDHEQGRTYKYRGIEESKGKYQQMKERLKKEYTKR